MHNDKIKGSTYLLLAHHVIFCLDMIEFSGSFLYCKQAAKFKSWADHVLYLKKDYYRVGNNWKD